MTPAWDPRIRKYSGRVRRTDRWKKRFDRDVRIIEREQDGNSSRSRTNEHHQRDSRSHVGRNILEERNHTRAVDLIVHQLVTEEYPRRTRTQSHSKLIGRKKFYYVRRSSSFFVVVVSDELSEISTAAILGTGFSLSA